MNGYSQISVRQKAPPRLVGCGAIESVFCKFMTTPSGHQKHVSIAKDDEPDEWDQRIEKGGCAKEHYKLQDCYMDTKDWRKCKDEVVLLEC